LAHLQSDLSEFIGLLNSLKVEYLVVGGHAVAFHGHPRFTGDIDFFIRATPENADRMLRALDAFGFGSLGITTADARKGDRQPARLSCAGHALMENGRCGQGVRHAGIRRAVPALRCRAARCSEHDQPHIGDRHPNDAARSDTRSASASASASKRPSVGSRPSATSGAPATRDENARSSPLTS